MGSVTEVSDQCQATGANAVIGSSKLQLLIRVILVVVGLIPVSHIYYLITFTCSNSLNHDYQNVIPTVDAMLEPGYSWSNFVSDSSMGPHCLLVGILVHACSALLTDWQTRFDLFLGVSLAVLRVVLLVDCIGERWNRTSKWVLLTFFLWLNFGTTLCSTLTFGVACISGGVGLLGYALAVWGVTRCQGKVLPFVLFLVGGLVSASFGQFWTLATWTTLLLVVVLSKPKRLPFYLFWVMGVLISVLELKSMAQRPSDFHPRLNLIGFINVLGRSFTNDIGDNCLPMTQSAIVGCVGLLFLLLLLFLHFKIRTALHKVAVAAALVGFGLLGALIISMSRDAIAPWYSLYAMYFWTGLVAASIVLFQEYRREPNKTHKPLVLQFCALFPLWVVVGLYLQTNISYKDKDFYRRTHGPCSESTMRNFRTVPTYGEATLFAGQIGDLQVMHEVCEPLWRHNWSAFSPHQEWALQGDFILPSVAVSESEGTEALKWIDGTKLSRKRHWSDPEHLNLAFDLRNRVSWNLDLPALTTKAVLRTKVSLPDRKHSSNEQAVLKVDVFVKARNQLLKEMRHEFIVSNSWNNIEIPIERLAGKHVRIDFSGVPSEREKVALLEYPKIDVDVKKEIRTRIQSSKLPVCPSNTELSEQFPEYTPNDLVYSLSNEKEYKLGGLHIIGKDANGAIEFELDETTIPSLMLTPSLSVSSREYSQVVVEMAASRDVYPRLLCVEVVISGTDLRKLLIPTLADEALHKYSYDLKLLELEDNERITALKLLPTYLDKSGKTKVRSVRFIRRTSK